MLKIDTIDISKKYQHKHLNPPPVKVVSKIEMWDPGIRKHVLTPIFQCTETERRFVMNVEDDEEFYFFYKEVD